MSAIDEKHLENAVVAIVLGAPLPPAEVIKESPTYWVLVFTSVVGMACQAGKINHEDAEAWISYVDLVLKTEEKDFDELFYVLTKANSNYHATKLKPNRN